MSAVGHERPKSDVRVESAQLPIPDLGPRSLYVAFVPTRDIGADGGGDRRHIQSRALTDHLLARRDALAIAVVPNGAARARHEIRYCRGLQSTGVRSR
jgi:hypothetical protein